MRISRHCRSNNLVNSFYKDEMNKKLYDLNGFGSSERIYSVNFYPDW